MRLIIVACGRLKHGALLDIFTEYQKRLHTPCDIKEIDDRGRKPAVLQASDITNDKRLLAAKRLALTPLGKNFTTPDLADWLRHAQQHDQDLAFFIGGPDGFAAEALALLPNQLAFGAITLPHLLARVILMEQLYRAETIIRGHPYHHA